MLVKPSGRPASVAPLSGVSCVFAINLDRRADRWASLLGGWEGATVCSPASCFQRVAASDGAALDLSSGPLQRLFNLSNPR
jgi:hypothetical protein